jgi:Family of unknown function (DUF6502)
MTRSPIRGRKGAEGRRARRDSPASLPAPLIEAIGRFVRILARCGATPAGIVRSVRSAAEAIPRHWVSRADRMTRYNEGAGHVLTAWFCETAYLDPFGKPRALPLEGPSSSVTALVRSVDPRSDAREVLTYLLHTGAVRRQGRRYVPRARAVFLRGTEGPDYVHTQVVLTNMLATLEHNIHLKRTVRGWFEYFAENRQFPQRSRDGLDRYVAKLGKEMLSRLDAYMHRREVNRRPGEPTVRVGIGMHLYEGQPAPSPVRARRRGSRPVRARRKRRRGP